MKRSGEGGKTEPPERRSPVAMARNGAPQANRQHQRHCTKREVRQGLSRLGEHTGHASGSAAESHGSLRIRGAEHLLAG
jgi:hypothetical protein